MCPPSKNSFVFNSWPTHRQMAGPVQPVLTLILHNLDTSKLGFCLGCSHLWLCTGYRVRCNLILFPCLSRNTLTQDNNKLPPMRAPSSTSRAFRDPPCMARRLTRSHAGPGPLCLYRSSSSHCTSHKSPTIAMCCARWPPTARCGPLRQIVLAGPAALYSVLRTLRPCLCSLSWM